MFLFRWTKEQMGFTLTLSIQKLRYSDIANLDSTNQIEILIQRYIQIRGQHKMTFLSRVNKKGEIVTDKKSQSIHMTLYYDRKDNKFDKKKMTITGRVINDLSETEVELGQAQLDIAEDAKEEKTSIFAFKVQLESNNKHKCKITFNAKIQRNFNSGEISEPSTRQNSQKETNYSKKVKQVKEPQSSKRQQQARQTKSKKTQIASNKKQNQFTPKASYSQEKKIQEPILEKKRSKSKNAKQFIQNKLQQYYKQNKDHQSKKNQVSQTVRTNSHRKPQDQPASQDNDTVQLNRQIPTPPRLKANNNPSSLQLRLFQAQRLLTLKDKERSKLIRQLQAQKKISESLLEEQRIQMIKKQNNKSSKQVEDLKTKLMVANMKLSDLETSNRLYIEKAETAQATTDKQTQQLHYYKALLQKQKMKMAQIFQHAMEIGDNELLIFLEELAQEQ